MPNFSQLDIVSKLCFSAYHGNLAKLGELLTTPEATEKINAPLGPFAHSALFFACYGKANAETVKLLLSAGANPLQRDCHRRLPLHFAANSLDGQIIEVMLAIEAMDGYRLDAESEFNITPVHALFLPGVAMEPPIKDAKLQACIPLMFKDKGFGEGALKKKDQHGLSSVMLAKHLGLANAIAMQARATGHERIFQIYCKSLKMPGNINAVLSNPTYDFDRNKYTQAAFPEDIQMDDLTEQLNATMLTAFSGFVEQANALPPVVNAAAPSTEAAVNEQEAPRATLT
jgi:hypothetical protein